MFIAYIDRERLDDFTINIQIFKYHFHFSIYINYVHLIKYNKNLHLDFVVLMKLVSYKYDHMLYNVLYIIRQFSKFL